MEIGAEEDEAVQASQWYMRKQGLSDVLTKKHDPSTRGFYRRYCLSGNRHHLTGCVQE